MEAVLLEQTNGIADPVEEQLVAMRRPAYVLALRLTGSPEDAEDAVQQAYLHACSSLCENPTPRNVRTWFFTVVANEAKEHLRRSERRDRRVAAVLETGRIPSSGANPEMLLALRAALEGLDPESRALVSLCYEHGCNQSEAAVILGIPARTASHRLRAGLERLRTALKAAGFTAGGAAVIAGLAHTPPPEPAGLAAKVNGLVFGNAPGASAGLGAVSATVKGGLAMKFILGIVAAGAVAAGVATVNVVGRRSEPRETRAAPPPAAADIKPAPMNPYTGMQQREEVYEFTQKPTVKKEGAAWIITFASKANCDATVAVLDKDGKIIRHLASGVLGKNAPWPFQQNSLSQKIAWDGEDDMGRAVAADVLKDCTVNVSLGLQAKYERNIGWEPANFPGWGSTKEPQKYIVAKAKDDSLFVLGYWNDTGGTIQGRVFKEGKYVRTFWPPPAKDLDRLPQLGFKIEETVWGDKVWVTEGPGGSRYGTACMRPVKSRQAKTVEDATKEIFEFAGVSGQQSVPWPEELPKQDLQSVFLEYFASKYQRMAVDRVRDDIYISNFHILSVWPLHMSRLDGNTGEPDKTWFPDGSMNKVTEVCVGPDGLVYLSVGMLGYGMFVMRTTRDGTPVDFAGDAVVLPKGGGEVISGGGQYGDMEGKKWGDSIAPEPFRRKGAGDIKALWTGTFGHSSVQELGLYVTAKGDIVHGVANPSPQFFSYWEKKGIPSGIRSTDKVGTSTSCTVVWDHDGKLLTTAAVGDTKYSHGVVMDRDGNIYNSYFGLFPANRKNLFGLKGDKSEGHWGGVGSLIKFRGGAYPLGGAVETPSASALAVSYPGRKGVGGIEGGQWAYGSMTGHANFGCTCHNVRYDMDYFARPWVMAHHLYSVLVLDSNGNLIARLGKYGNVDDTDEDVKAGKDGLRFIWPRAVSVSDKALYVSDHNARRILKAALSYAAEETVPVP